MRDIPELTRRKEKKKKRVNINPTAATPRT